MTESRLREQLLERSDELAVPLSVELAGRLAAYFRLLAIWDARINLTGMDLSTPSPASIDRLLLEPVLASSLLQTSERTRLIDVGSGGGSPAIPIALATAGLSLVMVESRAKKCVFLREAVRELGLEHCRVLNDRFEQLPLFSARDQFDLLTVRAVRVGPSELETLSRFVAPQGRIALFRGDSERDEDLKTASVELTRQYPLLSSLGGRLAVFRLRNDVPRETT